METPGERPPTRLQVVCQEGWDGAHRHPQPAAGVQPAEQWCSSQSQPQPQLCYQQVLLLGSRGARQGPRRSSLFTGQAHRPRQHQRVRPPRMRPYARRLQHLLRPHARLRPHAGLLWPSSAVPSSVASAIPTPFCSEPRGRTLRLLPASPSPRPFLLEHLAHVPRCLEQAATRPARQ